MNKKLLKTLVMIWVLLFGTSIARSQDTESQVSSTRITVENVNQLEIINELQEAGGSIADIAFNTASNLVAVTSREDLVIWDLQQKQVQWKMPIKLGSRVRFSASGNMLVAASYPSLYLWKNVEDSEEWTELKKSDGKSVGAIGDVKFSNNDTEIVALFVQKRGIYRWQADTGKVLFEQYSESADESSLVTTAALSDDAQIGVIESNPSNLEIVDTAQGKLLSAPTLDKSLGNDIGLKPLIFSPDKHLILNARTPSHSSNSSLVSFNLKGEIDQQLKVDYKAIWVMAAYNPDGSLLALANEVDNRIHFFSSKDMKEITSFETKADSVSSLAFSPDGTLLASGGTDGTVRLWGVAG